MNDHITAIAIAVATATKPKPLTVSVKVGNKFFKYYGEEAKKEEAKTGLTAVLWGKR